MTQFYISPSRLYLLFLLVFFTGFSWAQDEELSEECGAPNKKVRKLLDKANAAQDLRSASEYFIEALSLTEDENATPYFEYAMFAYEEGLKAYRENPNPMVGDRNFVKAEQMFMHALEICEDFHADCFYYLGVINFQQEELDFAIDYFKKFKAFKHPSREKYPKDYSSKLQTVNGALGKLVKEQELLTSQVPFDPVIVKNVSSGKDEYFPMISPDNELIFYTRKLDRRNLGDLKSNMVEEFTWSYRDNPNLEFSDGTPVNKPFNDGSFVSYGAATVSVDNKEMIICACKYEKVQGMDYKNCDLYSTRFKEAPQKGKPFICDSLTNLGEGINTKDGWEAQPSLSSDGNTLFYTALRPSTQMDDIFISERNEDGTWGPSRPFIEINTSGKDKSPFLHQDSETLYFVSSVSGERQGVGGTDIFYVRMNEDGSWGEPENIGYPINTKEDEIGIFVSTDGELAYFSSRKGGRWNIYSFELYEKARPQKVIIAKGNLTDEKGEPVKDAKIQVSYANSDKVQEVEVKGEDGSYAVVIKNEEPSDVMITVKKDNHAFDSQLITEEVIEEGETVKSKDLQVRKIEVGQPYTINDILYNTASAELSNSSKFILRQFALFLKENPTAKITIQGHTDNEGDAQENLELSERRAEGVKDYLVSLGIKANRLDAVGFGETQPKVENTTEANKAQNRRTDFVINSI